MFASLVRFPRQSPYAVFVYRFVGRARRFTGALIARCGWLMRNTRMVALGEQIFLKGHIQKWVGKMRAGPTRTAVDSELLWLEKMFGDAQGVWPGRAVAQRWRAG